MGPPRGSTISPLLANIDLHYVFDLWVDVWRKKCARGDVVVVRYADDNVLGFQHLADADRFLVEFRGRLGKFGLELHPDKTRRIEFGRVPSETGKCKRCVTPPLGPVGPAAIVLEFQTDGIFGHSGKSDFRLGQKKG